jgi:ribosomal protein L12E/L44/L45/RPP1/RPP2
VKCFGSSITWHVEQAKEASQAPARGQSEQLDKGEGKEKKKKTENKKKGERERERERAGERFGYF